MFAGSVSLYGQCYERMPASAFYHKYNNTPGAVLIDVRPEGYFKRGSIPGAIHAPDSSSLNRIINQKGRYRAFFIYCNYPGRATEAAAILCNLKGRAITVLEDPLKLWLQQDLPFNDQRGFWQKLWNKPLW